MLRKHNKSGWIPVRPEMYKYTHTHTHMCICTYIMYMHALLWPPLAAVCFAEAPRPGQALSARGAAAAAASSPGPAAARPRGAGEGGEKGGVRVPPPRVPVPQTRQEGRQQPRGSRAGSVAGRWSTRLETGLGDGAGWAAKLPSILIHKMHKSSEMNNNRKTQWLRASYQAKILKVPAPVLWPPAIWLGIQIWTAVL